MSSQLDNSVLSPPRGYESDNNLSNLSDAIDSGNELDDESYETIENQLPELVQQGTINEIDQDLPEEELPYKNKEEKDLSSSSSSNI
jgi:hypothetical protein